MPKRADHQYKNNYEYKASTAYNTARRENESLERYYTRLAKAADQRMVRIERLAEEPDFKNVKKYAYATALKDIRSFGGKDRWNVKPPTDERKLYEKIVAMRYFLEAPTSTKSGIKEVYQKTANTINKNYGTRFTWQQLADYYNKGKADRAAKIAGGSGTALYAIGLIQWEVKALSDDVKTNKSIAVSDRTIDAAIDILRSNRSITGVPTAKKEREKLIAQLQNLYDKDEG